MSKGIYTAVSGAIAQGAKLDTIANNLANVNTPAFKRDSQLFREYLSAYEKEGGTITVPRIPASVESFYDMQGGDKSYVDVIGTSTDFSQGALRPTGNPLDLALDGEGFFEVATPQGVRLTRSGSFSIDSEGRVITKQGYPVLKSGGDGAPAGDGDTQAREIRVTGKPDITPEGEIYLGGESLGKISVVVPVDKQSLQKVGESLYTRRPGFDQTLRQTMVPKINQGYLEGSNVNLVNEMTDMISATRVFESTQKAIQAYDQMANKAANEISKIR